MVKIEKISFFEQPNCYMLSNGGVEVIVTTDIGPRIIGYRFVGSDNILGEIGPSNVVKTELGEWHPWGGHRLWCAPEAKPRSYVPDNDPVPFEIVGDDSIRLSPKADAATGIEKEILVTLDANSSQVTITHKLTNRGLWPVELAPWALTIMNGGGVTIIPNEPFIPHTDALLPARPMVLWHYTDFTDPRWGFTKEYLLLQCDPEFDYPQKIGVANKQEWVGYLRNDTLFVKRFPYIDGAKYADYGCNFETFTKGDFMEVETLAPLVTLEPNQSTTHVEEWFLFNGVEVCDDEVLHEVIAPLVDSTSGE